MADRRFRESIDDLDALLGALPPEIVAAIHALPERADADRGRDGPRPPARGALPGERGDPARPRGHRGGHRPRGREDRLVRRRQPGRASSGRSTGSARSGTGPGRSSASPAGSGGPSTARSTSSTTSWRPGSRSSSWAAPASARRRCSARPPASWPTTSASASSWSTRRNEIAGDGDIPHPAIGKARRMQVRTPALQHEVMIEAVENHMPQVIVIDEIGTELEAQAARTIAERGVQLIGTAHGNNLDNLMLNPTLSDLIGGIQSVTLGDEEARRRRTQKSVLERKAPPTFDVIVEIQDRERVMVHADVAETVDAMLRGDPVAPEQRWKDEAGVHKSQSRPRPSPREQLGRDQLGRERFSGLVGSGGGGWRPEPGWRGTGDYRTTPWDPAGGARPGYRPGASGGWRESRGRAGRGGRPDAARRADRAPRRARRAAGRRRGGPRRRVRTRAAPAGSRAAGGPGGRRRRTARRRRGALRRRRDRRPRAGGARGRGRGRARGARPRGPRVGAPGAVARPGVAGARGVQGGGGATRRTAEGRHDRRCRRPRRRRRAPRRPGDRRGRGRGRPGAPRRERDPADAAGLPARDQPQAPGAGRQGAPAAGHRRPPRRRGGRRHDPAQRVPPEGPDDPRGRGPGAARLRAQGQHDRPDAGEPDLDLRPGGGSARGRPAGDRGGDRPRRRARPSRWSWRRRTPTSGGSSTRWPSGPTWSRARAAGSRTAACGSTRTKRAPGARAGPTVRRAGRPAAEGTGSTVAPRDRGRHRLRRPRAGGRLLGRRPRLRAARRSTSSTWPWCRRRASPACRRSCSRRSRSRRPRRTGSTSTSGRPSWPTRWPASWGWGRRVIAERSLGDFSWTVLADPDGNEFCVSGD